MISLSSEKGRKKKKKEKKKRSCSSGHGHTCISSHLCAVVGQFLLFARLRWADPRKVTRPIQICRKQLPPAWVGMGEDFLRVHASHSIILWNSQFTQCLAATYIVGVSPCAIPTSHTRIVGVSWHLSVLRLEIIISLHFSSQSVFYTHSSSNQ